MSIVIGVRFKKAGKVYYFDPGDFEINQGDYVIVETVRGVEYGEVVLGKKEVDDKSIVKPLKQVIKKADESDAQKVEENRRKEQEAFDLCLAKIEKHQMNMKLIGVEYTFDKNKIIFYFTADGRVDFRELVKDLASVFKTRIELRQIGVRDEAKMVGGLGPCGRPCCCAVFLGDFQPVSIKMAKEQNLSLSPTKISGLCGRLMCCLNYEQEYYEMIQKKLPNIGSEVTTPDGQGTVFETNPLTQKVKVKILLKDNTVDLHEYDLNQVVVVKQRQKNEEIVIDEEIKSLLDE